MYVYTQRIHEFLCLLYTHMYMHKTYNIKFLSDDGKWKKKKLGKSEQYKREEKYKTFSSLLFALPKVESWNRKKIPHCKEAEEKKKRKRKNGERNDNNFDIKLSIIFVFFMAHSTNEYEWMWGVTPCAKYIAPVAKK